VLLVHKTHSIDLIIIGYRIPGSSIMAGHVGVVAKMSMRAAAILFLWYSSICNDNNSGYLELLPTLVSTITQTICLMTSGEEAPLNHNNKWHNRPKTTKSQRTTQ